MRLWGLGGGRGDRGRRLARSLFFCFLLKCCVIEVIVRGRYSWGVEVGKGGNLGVQFSDEQTND